MGASHVEDGSPTPASGARAGLGAPDAGAPDAGAPDAGAPVEASRDTDRQALDALVPAIDAELRRQARRALRREAAGHTLTTTGLVHEMYLRVAVRGGVACQEPGAFSGIAAHRMRQILVDHARTRLAAKRGGGSVRVTLSHAGRVPAADADAETDVLALHAALGRLAPLDPDQARVVALRYFGGLTLEETGAALGVSPATVKREWAVARAWLRRELRDR